MKLKVIIHQAEEGGYWAEVPAIPGCVSQGETHDELLSNIQEAIEVCLSVDAKDYEISDKNKFWGSLVEECFRQRTCSATEEERLEAEAYQGQPPCIC